MLFNFDNRCETVQRVFENEENLKNFSKLRSDLVKDTLEGVTKDKAEKTIKARMFALAGLSAGADARQIRAAMRKTAAREAAFEIVTETVEDTLISGWQNDPFFKKYVEIKNYNLGQTNVFYVPDNTDLIVSEVSSSNHDMTRQRLGIGREVSVKVRSYGAKVYMEVERYMMGAEDWSALIGKISIAYTRVLNTLLHDAVMSAGKTLPSPNQWNVTGQLEATNHDDFVKLISDVATATGTQPIIMGTKVALAGLRKMGDVDFISNEAKSDVYRTGRLGLFEGIEIAEIPQAFAPNDTSKYLVDDTKLLIMPGNIDQFVKLYYEGDTQIKEVTDRNVNMDGTMEYELVMKFGVAVLTNTRFGTWTIG